MALNIGAGQSNQRRNWLRWISCGALTLALFSGNMRPAVGWEQMEPLISSSDVQLLYPGIRREGTGLYPDETGRELESDTGPESDTEDSNPGSAGDSVGADDGSTSPAPDDNFEPNSGSELVIDPKELINLKDADASEDPNASENPNAAKDTNATKDSNIDGDSNSVKERGDLTEISAPTVDAEPAEELVIANEPPLAGQLETLETEIAETELADIVASAISYNPTPGVARWAGNSRLGTATTVANNSNLRLATTAFVAYGWDFPDALAAAAAAGKLAAPILLVGDGIAGAQTAITYLTNNMPNLQRVIILGGVSRITQDIENHIKNVLQGRGATVDRIAGADRYETAARVARRFFKDADQVFLAAGYGDKFPDALAAASLAGKLNGPVLLTEQGKVPQSVITYLSALPNAITINLVGGTSSVADSVKTQLRQALPDKKITFPDRLAGAGRYETAVTVAQEFERQVDTPSVVFLATGEDYPDALAGAPAAAVANAPVLLTAKAYLPTVVRDYVRNRPAISSAIYLGGEATISAENKDLLQTIINNRPNFTPVTSVALSANLTVEVGQTQNLTATVTPKNATSQTKFWTSSNSKVATVTAAGVVKAVNTGTATIRVTTVDGGFQAQTKVTVQKPPAPIAPPAVENVRIVQSPDGIANIRTGPGTGYYVIGTLRNGDAVTVVEARNGWCRVTGKVTGWVANWLLGPNPNSRLIAATEWWRAKGARAWEHPAYGGVTPGAHMTNSLHYVGRAVDLNYGPEGENDIEKAFFDSLLPSFHSAFPFVHVYWRVTGHYDHLHLEE